MYKRFYDLVMKVDFEEAKRLFLKMSKEEQWNIIEKLVYDLESMIVYAFLEYVNEKNEKIEFHEMEFDILSNALCYIEGAYQMAYYHNKRLLELVPDSVKYMQWMLIFYDVKVISKEKTIMIANNILAIDKNNKIAREFIERLT